MTSGNTNEQCAVVPENWHESFIERLASVLKPVVYLELGLYHCDLFNRIIPHAQTLIGVDINEEAGTFMVQSEKTSFVYSTTDEFAESLRANPGIIDLLFIDANHSKDSVLKDFWNFFPFVASHGIILLHDTHPKNPTYSDAGYCGDAYLVAGELAKHADKIEFMTIPIHPGLTICRKRTSQLSWQQQTHDHNDVVPCKEPASHGVAAGRSVVNDPELLTSLKKACYTQHDVRAGWIGPGYPYTDVSEFKPLARWAALGAARLP